MKKYIIASIIALVAIVTSVNVYQTNNEFNLTDLALSNVEALADSEFTFELGDCRWNWLFQECHHFSYGSMCAPVDQLTCEPLS